MDHAPQQLGFGTMSGIEVCASLTPALETAQLNPGSQVTLPVGNKVANAILVFTAADAVDGLFERVPREKHANVIVNSIVGRELFQ